MALNDNAVVLPARGFIFTAPVGTASPTPSEIDAFDPAVGTISGWEPLGHTARDELPVFGFDGGDTEVKGTWQNASLREVVTEVATDYVTFNLHQMDESSMGLYYGVTNPGSTVGKFDVTDTSTSPIQRALLIIIVDGTTNVGFHSTKTSIRREDAIELAIDEFIFMPVRATFLKHNTEALFSWLSTDTGVNVS